jgi:hypothetical protein
MIHVFVPLSNLRNIVFVNVPFTSRIALTKLSTASIPTDSAFYSDGRRHLSKQVKKKIDELLKQLNAYNKQVDSLNPAMSSRINEIINPAMPGPLDEKFVPSIFQIIRDAFTSVVLTSDGEIEDAFKSYDMQRKIQQNGTGAYGFTGQEQRAISTLNAVETNTRIRQDLQGLRNMIVNIRLLVNSIGNESSEIIQEIYDNRYHKKRLCCPSLIKELWHSFI